MMRILMVGPHRTVRGGMAACINLYYDHWQTEQAELRYIGTYHECAAPCKIVTFLVALVRVIGLLIIWRPQIMHLHFSKRAGFYRKAILMWLARNAGLKTIMHAHGPLFPAFYDSQIPLAQRFIRSTLNATTIVIALTPAWANYYQQLVTQAQVITLANPVKLVDDKAQPTSHPCILALVRLTPLKGVPEMLEAARILHHTHPNVPFVIGGDGDIPTWKAQAPINVSFPGWLSDKAKSDALRNATIFIQPSHAEGMSLAVLEAMSYGLPVIVSDARGLPDLIQHEQTGLVVPVGDAEALAASIQRLLDDVDLRQRLGHAARSHVLEHYTAVRIMMKLYDIYEKILYGLKDSKPLENDTPNASDNAQ